MCWQDRTANKVLSNENAEESIPLKSWTMITIYGGEVFVMKDPMKHIHLRTFGFDILIVTFEHRHFPLCFRQNPNIATALTEKIDDALVKSRSGNGQPVSPRSLRYI
jgi:hypothetical protein